MEKKTKTKVIKPKPKPDKKTKTKVIKMNKKSKTKPIKPKPIKPNKKSKTKVIKPNKKSKTRVIIGGDSRRLIKDSKSTFLIFHSQEYADVAKLFKDKLELSHNRKHKTIKVNFEDINIYKIIMNEYNGIQDEYKRIVIMFKKDRGNNESGAKEYFRKVTNLLTDIGNELKDKKNFVFFPFECRQDQGDLGESNDFYTKFGAVALESIDSMNYYYNRLHLMRQMFMEINLQKNLKSIYFFNLDRLEVVKNREVDNIFQNTGHINCQLNDKSEKRFNGVFDLIINKEFRPPEYSPHDPDCSKTFKIDITSENNYLGDPIEVQEANRWEMGIKCKKIHGDPIDSFDNFREKDRSKSFNRNTPQNDGSSLQENNGIGNRSYLEVVRGINKGIQEIPAEVSSSQYKSPVIPDLQMTQAQQPNQIMQKYNMQPYAVNMHQQVSQSGSAGPSGQPGQLQMYPDPLVHQGIGWGPEYSQFNSQLNSVQYKMEQNPENSQQRENQKVITSTPVPARRATPPLPIVQGEAYAISRSSTLVCIDCGRSFPSSFFDNGQLMKCNNQEHVGTNQGIKFYVVNSGGAKKKQEYKKYKIKEVLGKNKQIFKEKDKKSKKEYIKHKKEYILVKDYIKLMKK
jgi:hypothetical protein